MPIDKNILRDYVATANSGKYSTIEEVNSKFPELSGYDANLLKDYLATANSGKYSTLEEVNSKFPEFNVEPEKKKPLSSKPTQTFSAPFSQGVGASVKLPSPLKSPSTSTTTTTTTPKVKPIEATQQPIKLQQRTPSGQPDFVPPQEVVKQLTERGQAPYDEVKERNRLQNGAQGIQKAQANAAKQLQQRDEILAQIEETKALLEQSKGNPNTYNQLVPQYNELVKQAQSVSDNFKSELQKIDIYEKGISATQLKIQMNEDSGDLRWQSGVNSFKQMALLALPTTARYAGYFGARSRGIPPDMAYKVAKDFSEQNFGGLIDSARELAAENEELQEVFSKESAWQAIKSGDIDKTADLATKELMGTLPVTLGLMLTYVNPYVGATSTIMGTAGMELEELEGEDMSPEGKMTNALVKGGLEYATERIFGTIPMVKRAIGAKSKAGQEVVENLLLQTWNKYAKKMGFSADVIEEVGSEMINTIGGNYTDYLTGKTDDLQLLKDIGQTFTTSLSMAALLSGGGRAMKYSSKKIDDLRGNTKKLQEIAERQETTPEVLEVIQENIVANNEKIGEESQKEKEVFDSMTEEEWDEATALIQENQSLQEQIEAGEVQPEILPVIEKKIEENTAIVEDIKKEVVATLDERQQARVSALENLKIADEEISSPSVEFEKPSIELSVKENPFKESLRKLGYQDSDIDKMTMEQMQEIATNKTEAPIVESSAKVDSVKENKKQERLAEMNKELDQEGETQEVKPTEAKEEVAPKDVSVKSFKKGDGGTRGVFEDKDGKLYKSIEPQELIMTDKGAVRQPIKDAVTDEHKILSELQDNPHIPKVGKIVDTTEGKAFEIEKLDEVDSFTKDEYREIQKILNDLNDKGYHVGDKVTVMKRPKTGELVIVDFSAGYKGSRMTRDAEDYMQNISEKLSKSDAINIRLEDLSEINKDQANAFFDKESTTEYYLTQRPPSIGTHPTEGLLSVNEAEYRDRKNVYILKYNRKLTPNEIYKFELTPKVTNKEFLGQKILGVFGKTPFYVTNIDYKKGIVKMSAEVNGKQVEKEISFREFSKNIDEGKYKVESLKEAQAEEAVSENKASEPRKSDKNYQDAQEVNSIVSKENPDASVLIQPKGEDLSLTAIYVGKEKRGKGIGSKVLESVKKQANKLGKKVVLDATNELDSETDLERLGNFYEKNGFKKVGENKYEYDPKAKDSSRDIGSRADDSRAKKSDIAADTNKKQPSEKVDSTEEAVSESKGKAKSPFDLVAEEENAYKKKQEEAKQEAKKDIELINSDDEATIEKYFKKSRYKEMPDGKGYYFSTGSSRIIKQTKKQVALDTAENIVNKKTLGLPQSRVEEIVKEFETNKQQEDATKSGKIKQSNLGERKGVTEQQQGKQEDRVNQEEPITQGQTSPSGGSGVIESGQEQEVKPKPKKKKVGSNKAISKLQPETKRDFIALALFNNYISTDSFNRANDRNNLKVGGKNFPSVRMNYLRKNGMPINELVSNLMNDKKAFPFEMSEKELTDAITGFMLDNPNGPNAYAVEMLNVPDAEQEYFNNKLAEYEQQLAEEKLLEEATNEALELSWDKIESDVDALTEAQVAEIEQLMATEEIDLIEQVIEKNNENTRAKERENQGLPKGESGTKTDKGKERATLEEEVTDYPTLEDVKKNPENFRIIKSFDAKFARTFGVQGGKPYVNKVNLASGVREYSDYPISNESNRPIRYVMMLADKSNYDKYFIMSYDGYIRLTKPEWWDKIKEYKAKDYRQQILIFELLPKEEQDAFINSLISNPDNYSLNGSFDAKKAFADTPFDMLANLTSEAYEKFTKKELGEKKVSLSSRVAFEAMGISDKFILNEKLPFGIKGYSTDPQYKSEAWYNEFNRLVPQEKQVEAVKKQANISKQSLEEEVKKAKSKVDSANVALSKAKSKMAAAAAEYQKDIFGGAKIEGKLFPPDLKAIKKDIEQKEVDVTKAKEAQEKAISKLDAFVEENQQQLDLADKAISFLENLKADTKGKGFDAVLGIPIGIWNATIDTITLSIKAGVSISDAIKRGLNYIQKNHRGAWDKKGFNQKVLEELGLRGIEVNGEDLIVKPVEKEFASVVNGFYSDIEQSLLDTNKNNLSGKDWILALGNSDEANWTGLTDWLSKQEGSISKADIRKFLKDNRIEVVEVVKGQGELNVVPMEDEPNILEVFAADDPNGDYRGGIGEILIEDNGKFTANIPEAPQKTFNTQKEAEDYIKSKTNYAEQTKFSEYQLEGEKENYKEVLVTLPSAVKELPSNYKSEKTAWETYQIKDEKGNVISENGGLAQATVDALAKINKSKGSISFISGHFSEQNILVHLRMNIRKDSEGNKVLFLEEVQSDWGQKGKKEGFFEKPKMFEAKDIKSIKQEGLLWLIDFGAEYEEVGLRVSNFPTKESAIEEAVKKLNDENDTLRGNVGGSFQVPQAPFVTDTNAWTKLGLKVALKEAVKQGADKIAWTTGEQQNERYDLSKQVDDISAFKKEDGTYEITARKSGQKTFTDRSVPENKLEGIVGKELAKKIIEDLKTNKFGKTYEGNDLKVGGAGMKGFYGSPTERAKAPKLTIEKVGDKFKVGSREFKTENEAKKYIDEYGLGIVGNVAKSLFKQEPKTTKIDIGNEYLSTWDNAKAQGFKVIEKSEYKNASSYTKDFVIVDKDGDAVASSDTKQMAIDVFLKTSNLAQVEQRKVSIQNSIDITPELKASVEGGLPLFGNVIQALERLKSNQGGKMNASGILPAAWNAIIDTLILGVKAGKAINKLVQEAIEKLKNESSTFDEKAFKDMLIEGGVVTEEELVGEGTKGEGNQKKSGFQERSIEESTNEVVKEIARENEVYYTEMNQKKEYEAAQKDFGTTEDVIQNFVDLKIGQTLTLDEAARVQVARQVAMQTLSIEISKQVAMGNDPVKLNDMVNQIQNSLAKDFAKGGQIGAMAVWKFMTPTGIVYQVQQKIKEANAAAELKLNAEQKAELAEMEAKIADLQAKLDEEIAKTAERKANKPKKQKEFSQEKKNRKAELKEILRKKMFGQLNDVSNIARIIFEKETIEYAKLVIEEGAIDFNSFAKEMSSDFGKAIRPYLPSLYEKVSGEGVIDAESRKQMEEYLQKNFSKAYGTSRIPTNRKPKKDLDRILEGVNQGVLNDDFYKSLFLEKFGMKANLTASEVAELQRLAAAVTSLPPTSKLYNIAVLNMAQFIDSKYPRSFFSDLIDTWVALFYANMLSGVSTHVLNIVSTGSGIMNSPFRNAVNLSKWVRSIRMGIKDKSLSSLIAYNPIYESYFIPPMHIEGVKIGTDLFMDTLTEGATNDKYIEGLVNQTSKITIPTLEQNRYGKGMRYRPIRIGKYDINPYNKAKYVGRSLAAEDALMNWSAYEMELTQLATEIFREKGYRGKKLRDAVVEAFTNKSVDMAEIDRKLQSEIDTFNLSGKQLSERAKRIRRSELVVEAGLNAMNATLEQRQQTKDLAASATFTDDRNGVISRVAQLLSMAANYNRFTQVTIKPWIPFTKVVANVTEFAFDTLPIYGLMRANGMGVTGLISKVAKDTRNKEFKSSQMGEVGTQAYYEQMSRAWQGTIAFSAALMVFGVSGDDDDYEDNYVQLTGSYNEELKKGIRGREDVIPPYSIKIGNFLMSYKSIPVVNVALACIGNYNDYMNMKRYSKEELDERMTLALKYSAVESITMVKDMSFIEGMKDLLEIISIATDVSKWDKVGKKVLEKYAGFVGKPLPQNNAMVNQVSKFFDPVSYSRKEVQDILAYSAGLQRMYGTPNRDIFGETVKSYPSEGTIPYTHWFNLNVADADIRFLSRYNAIPDGLQNRKSKIFNTELGVYELRKMEPVEFDKYVELSGKLFREKLHNYQQTTNADERANKQEEYGGNSYNGVAFDVNKLQNEAAEEAKAKLFLAKSLEVDELKRISAIKALDRLSKVESDSTSDANKELLMQEGGITENELRIKKNVEDNKKNASVYMIEEIRKQGIIEPLDQEMFLLRMRDLGIISKDNYNESLKILGILPIE
jgi:ribosomal protein S18 acetylase RimI-like enzyme